MSTTPDRPTSVWSVPGMRVLAVMTLCGFAGPSVLLPVAPLWAVHGGAGEAGAGLVNGVMMAATVATQVGVPRMLHRWGWASVIAAGMALMGGGSLLHLLGEELWLVLVVAAVRGMGFGIVTVTGSAAAGLLVDPARRGAAVGAYGLAVALPNVVLLPLGPTVVEHWGFTPAFVIAAAPLLGVPLAWSLAHHLTEDDEDETATGRPTKAMAAPAFVLLAVTMAGGALITFAPQMVLSARTATVGLFLMGLVAAIGRWRVGAPADRWGPHRFMAPMVLATVLGMLLIAWAVLDPALAGAAYWVFLLGCTVLGLAYGALQNLTLVVAFAATSRAETHTASAVWNIGFDSGTALGSVLVGLIASGVGFPLAMLVAGLFSLVTLPFTRQSRVAAGG